MEKSGAREVENGRESTVAVEWSGVAMGREVEQLNLDWQHE